MAQDNVEIVRRSFAAHQAGGIEAACNGTTGRVCSVFTWREAVDAVGLSA